MARKAKNRHHQVKSKKLKMAKKNAWLCKEGLSKNKHMNMRKQVYAILRDFHRHFKIVLIDY
jgi:hypothetical protein